MFINIIISSQCIVINMYVKMWVCGYKPEIPNYSVMEIAYTQMRSIRNYLDKLKMRLEKNHNIYLLHFPNVWNAARWLKSSHFWNHVDLKWNIKVLKIKSESILWFVGFKHLQTTNSMVLYIV